MKPTRFALVAAACMLMAAHAVSQGLYFEATRSSGEATKFWYMPGKLKSADSDAKITIIRLDKETLYEVNPETRSYTEMTFADMKKMYDTGQSMLGAMMKQRLEMLPPEKRKSIEEKMAALNSGSRANVKYDVVSTGETKTISGYPCAKYIVNRDGKEFATIWSTKALGNLEAIHNDMEKLSENMASVVKGRSAPLSWFKDIPGFPIENDQAGNTSTVSHVEKRPVSDSEFEVPAGYTKEESDMFKGMQGE